MISLEESYHNAITSHSDAISRMKDNPTDLIQVQSDIRMLWHYNKTFALHALCVEHNIEKCKQHFYTCGDIDRYLIKKYDERILDSGVSNLLFSVLSDSLPLMNDYANLGHSKYKWMVEHGHSTLLYAIQQVIKNDWESLRWSLNIMATKNLKLNKALLSDQLFFDSILKKDQAQVSKAIGQLLKQHNKRNKYLGIGQNYISIPALGYLKLAWLKGIEINVVHPLLPKELLPFKPLTDYRTAYDFLK